jgi:hypothetical protein
LKGEVKTQVIDLIYRQFHDFGPTLAHEKLTLQHKNVVYQIQTSRPSYGMRNALVIVCENGQENIEILSKGQPFDYAIYQ